LKIAELFYSLQGEGSLIGVPSVFIRASGCNLRCSWCDTPYTSWNPEGREMPIDEIVAETRRHHARHVVITGGEPLIAPEILPLTQRLAEYRLHITIETAGTVFQDVACDLMSISPKLSNSTPEGQFAAQHERLRRQPEVLKRLMVAYEHQLKFVVTRREDLEEIHQLLIDIGADRNCVMLMPEGRDPVALHERGLWLAEVCKEAGFRFSPRLHIDLWGDRRGV
jgi:7-carboxy-7-deazaguanine synthase